MSIGRPGLLFLAIVLVFFILPHLFDVEITVPPLPYRTIGLILALPTYLLGLSPVLLEVRRRAGSIRLPPPGSSLLDVSTPASAEHDPLLAAEPQFGEDGRGSSLASVFPIPPWLAGQMSHRFS